MTRPQVTSYDDVMERCRKHGDAIVVHFAGGPDALATASIGDVRKMPHRWRPNDADQSGVDWIPGELFRRMVGQKTKGQTSFQATGQNEELKNYHDKASSLAEITRIAKQHGPAILVGFDDGRGPLRRASAAELQARPWYKWDWAAHPVGTKYPAHWIPGDEFLAILRETGVLSAIRG